MVLVFSELVEVPAVILYCGGGGGTSVAAGTAGSAGWCGGDGASGMPCLRLAHDLGDIFGFSLVAPLQPQNQLGLPHMLSQRKCLGRQQEGVGLAGILCPAFVVSTAAVFSLADLLFKLSQPVRPIL